MSATHTEATRTALAVRWGIASSIIFGSFGWIVGMTIPGGLHGTSFAATVLWSLILGSLAYIPGDLAGKTIGELRARSGW